MKLADEFQNPNEKFQQEVYVYSIEITEEMFDSTAYFQKILDDNVKIGFIATKCFEDVNFARNL